MSSFNIQTLESCFKHSTIKSTFASLYRCIGTITAIASGPELIRPSEWMQQLQADPDVPLDFDDEVNAKAISNNLIAWWNYCLTQFEEGQKISLPVQLELTATGKPNKVLKEFCTGYLQGYNWLSKSWSIHLPNQNTDEARSVKVLNMILARLVDDKALAKAEPALHKELPDIAGCFKTMPSLLSAVGMLGRDLYAESNAEVATEKLISPHRNATRNVGRNEDCPCGSGKKFKKCCLH